jgi:uncharacterized protein YuzB (UPF0349 family)
MNEFKICNKCRGYDFEELKKELEKLDSSAKIIVGCQSMCAIGAKRPFVIVNGIPVIEESIEEVIKKVKEML